MKNCYWFVGPTLHGQHCPKAWSDLGSQSVESSAFPKTILNHPKCTILPPATRNSVLDLVQKTEVPGTIVLIDGSINTRLAVNHTELCVALDQGWELWGLGDMGAIRAYEMRTEGMKGYGKVFRYFETVSTLRDDEVLWHAEDLHPYAIHNEPLIHFREALNHLVQHSQLTEGEAQEVFSHMDQVWYQERTLELFLSTLSQSQPKWTQQALDSVSQQFSRFRIKFSDFHQFLEEFPLESSP